jgi:hypothetical protein
MRQLTAHLDPARGKIDIHAADTWKWQQRLRDALDA